MISTLAQGTAAYTAAMQARQKLAEQFQIELLKLHAQEVQAAQAAADQTTRAYEQAFSSIGSSGNRAIEGLILGHMSWFKAAQTVTQGVLSTFLSLTETLISRWTAMEVARLDVTGSTSAEIQTIQGSSANSGWPQLLASWLGLEATRTSISVGAAATRAGLDSGPQVSADLAKVVADWSATEASKTALTTGGAATRATADSGAGLSADLGKVVADWSATEAAKTGATTAGAATRATVDAGAQMQAELAQVIAKWSATEATKTAVTTTGAATRSTVNSGAQLQAELAQVVAKWSATEATKTAVTSAGAATRATADSGGGFLASIAQILARWLGLETAKTGATTAQAAVRTSVEATATANGAQLVGLQARLQIAAAAAEAAAWAFADSASAGPAGLAAAPGVAAAAEGTVMAYQALVPLAQGAWDTGSGGEAMLHEHEMVVPQTYASGIRSAMAGGGGSSTSNVGGNVHATYAPTFHGSGNAMASQASSEFKQMQRWVGNISRNGNLIPPRVLLSGGARD